MQVNYATYFHQLLSTEYLYKEQDNSFATGAIKNSIVQIIQLHKSKYPKLQFNTENLIFDSLVAFNASYLHQLIAANFETIR